MAGRRGRPSRVMLGFSDSTIAAAIIPRQNGIWSVLASELVADGPGLRLRGSRNPGDIVVENKNFRLFFPITTCIIISIVASFLFWFIERK